MVLKIQKGCMRGINFLYYWQEITVFLAQKQQPVSADLLLPAL
jgi:hypothetical protein